MEGLSAAASGLAVASMAIQLADNVKKLHDFWDSIKDAPETVRAITNDLQLLSRVLADIALEAQHSEPDVVLEGVLSACTAKVDALNAIVNDLEPGFSSSNIFLRKWTAFRSTLKKDKIKNFQTALERVKATLALGQQSHNGRLGRIPHQLVMTALTDAISTLSLRETDLAQQPPIVLLDGQVPNSTNSTHLSKNQLSSSSGNLSWLDDSLDIAPSQIWTKHPFKHQHTITEYFFGTVFTRSMRTLMIPSDKHKGFDDQNSNCESRTILIFRPSSWLKQIGLKYGFNVGLFSSPISGWKHSLRTFTLVPDNSPIFELSAAGNISAVKSLLASGGASARDTDSYGRTALHFAAENHYPELCKLLIRAGADSNARTHSSVNTSQCYCSHHSQSPLLNAVADTFVRNDTLQATMDTVRVFADCLDFTFPEADGWETISYIAHNSMSTSDEEAKLIFLVWILRLSSFDIRFNYIEASYARTLNFLMNGKERDSAYHLFLSLGPKRAIDAVDDSFTYSCLMKRMVYVEQGLSPYLSLSPDLHFTAYNSDYSPNTETPTSLAMYSSWAFHSWLAFLLLKQVDIASFVQAEIDQKILIKQGCSAQTLQTLFDWEFVACYDVEDDRICSDCSKCMIALIVQPYWLCILEQIKRGKHFGRLQGNRRCASLNIRTCEAASDESWIEDQAGQPSSPHRLTNTDGLRCDYEFDDVTCMDCWLHYKRTGRRNNPPGPHWKKWHWLQDDDMFSPCHEYCPWNFACSTADEQVL